MAEKVVDQLVEAETSPASDSPETKAIDDTADNTTADPTVDTSADAIADEKQAIFVHPALIEDPDEGLSDEERAKLVRNLRST
jgi:hypothetical protein